MVTESLSIMKKIMTDTKQEKNNILRRTLSQNLKVSAIGLGCMGMSGGYGAPDEAESMKTIRSALDLGIDFLDTAEMYGPFVNEELRYQKVTASVHSTTNRRLGCTRN